MSVPREERLARQQFDPGAPDDRVYHGRARGVGNSATSYHDDEECSFLQRHVAIEETTREGAQRRWLQPCSYCVPLSENAPGARGDEQ